MLEKAFTVMSYFLRSFKDSLANELSDDKGLVDALIQGFNSNVTLEQVMEKQKSILKENLMKYTNKEDRIFSLKKIALSLALSEAVISSRIPEKKIHNLCEILLRPDDIGLDELIMENSILDEIFQSKVGSDEKMIKYAPKMLKLPANYEEFNTRYFLKKCKLCDTYCKHLHRSICLICGQVFCEIDCKMTKRKYGNLNQHSMEYHMGLGLYLEMHNLWKSVVSTPVNMRFTEKNPYVDKLGQAVQRVLDTHRDVARLDFKGFSLNREFVEDCEDVIYNHRMRNDVFRIVSLRKVKEFDGIL